MLTISSLPSQFRGQPGRSGKSLGLPIDRQLDASGDSWSPSQGLKSKSGGPTPPTAEAFLAVPESEISLPTLDGAKVWVASWRVRGPKIELVCSFLHATVRRCANQATESNPTESKGADIAVVLRHRRLSRSQRAQQQNLPPARARAITSIKKDPPLQNTFGSELAGPRASRALRDEISSPGRRPAPPIGGHRQKPPHATPPHTRLGASHTTTARSETAAAGRRAMAGDRARHKQVLQACRMLITKFRVPHDGFRMATNADFIGYRGSCRWSMKWARACYKIVETLQRQRSTLGALLNHPKVSPRSGRSGSFSFLCSIARIRLTRASSLGRNRRHILPNGVRWDQRATPALAADSNRRSASRWRRPR